MTHAPNDQAILDIRNSINLRRARRDRRWALARQLLAWAALMAAIAFVSLSVVSCASDGPLIGPCPPDRCVGPYDLTLSSHREALDVD